MSGEVDEGEGASVRLPLAAEFSDHQGIVATICIDDGGRFLYSADDEVTAPLKAHSRL